MPRYSLPTNVDYTVDDIIRLSQTIQQVKRNMRKFRTFGTLDWEKFKRNQEYLNRLVVQLATAVMAVMT